MAEAAAAVEWPRKPIVTSIELAALTGLNRRTVRREIGRGNLQAFLVGSGYVIMLAEAQRWHAAYRKNAGNRKDSPEREAA